MRQASLAARLDFAACGGAAIVDRAADAAADFASQRHAATGGIETKMRPTVGIPHDEAADEVRPFEERVLREHLDVVDETLGAVLVRIGAAGATPKAVEARVGAPSHAPS
jgi:hypothetical protein